MPNPLWNDLRRTADELEVKIHLASMDARDRWQKLKPRIEELEKTIAREGDRIGRVISEQVSELTAAVRRLHDDIVKNPKS